MSAFKNTIQKKIKIICKTQISTTCLYIEPPHLWSMITKGELEKIKSRSNLVPTC